MNKFDDLKIRLKIAKNKISKKSLNNNNQSSSSMGLALKLGTELVAAVLVGTIIGFILDNWFDTKPWLIIIFFFAIFKRVDISLRFFIILVSYLSN